jgi:hypothetical protein
MWKYTRFYTIVNIYKVAVFHRELVEGVVIYRNVQNRMILTWSLTATVA